MALEISTVYKNHHIGHWEEAGRQHHENCTSPWWDTIMKAPPRYEGDLYDQSGAILFAIKRRSSTTDIASCSELYPRDVYKQKRLYSWLNQNHVKTRLRLGNNQGSIGSRTLTLGEIWMNPSPLENSMNSVIGKSHSITSWRCMLQLDCIAFSATHYTVWETMEDLRYLSASAIVSLKGRGWEWLCTKRNLGWAWNDSSWTIYVFRWPKHLK